MVNYGVRVKDVMGTMSGLIMPTDSIQDAAKMMKKNKWSGLVVVDKTMGPIGIITLKDLVYKALTKGMDPKTTKVSVIMSKELVTVGPDEDISSVITKMRQYKIRRMPVVKKRELVGYISETNLCEIQPEILDVLIEKLKVLEPSFKFKLYKRRG